MRRQWARVPNAHKTATLLIVVIALGMALSFIGGLLAHAPTITNAKTIKVAPSSGVGVAASWGKPDQEIAGDQLSSSLAGLTCGVWQAHRAIVCYPA